MKLTALSLSARESRIQYLIMIIAKLKTSLFNQLPGLVSRGRNVPDCLPVSSDRQNVFLPVSTNIQLEQYFFNIILFSLFETQLGL